MESFTEKYARSAFVPAVLAILALVAGCATPAAVPATEQPALTRMVEPYASDLRKVGITSVLVYSNRARIRLTTRMSGGGG